MLSDGIRKGREGREHGAEGPAWAKALGWEEDALGEGRVAGPGRMAGLDLLSSVPCSPRHARRHQHLHRVLGCRLPGGAVSAGGDGPPGPGGHPLRLVPGPGLGQFLRRAAHRGSLPGSGPRAQPETEAGPGHLSLEAWGGGREAGLGLRDPSWWAVVSSSTETTSGGQEPTPGRCGLSSEPAVLSAPVCVLCPCGCVSCGLEEVEGV